MNWNTNKLKNVTTKIGSGATPKGGQGSYGKEGIPLIRSLNIHDLNFNFKNLAYINETQAKKLNNVKIEKDDVLLNITGASVCRCTSVPDSLLPARVNQHVSIIRADNISLSGKFLKYVLVSPVYKKRLYSLATNGGTREALTKSDLENFEIKYPDIHDQLKISRIISSYENLIQNNNDRIKILKKMSELIYAEWSINFKLPGNIKKNKSDKNDQIAALEGWEKIKIGDKFNVILGGTPSRKVDNFWLNGTIPWINSGKVNEFRIIDESELITEIALLKSAAKMMPARTTLIAITGATMGQVSLSEIECCANQSVIGIFDGNNLYNEYIYLKICEVIKSIIGLAGGGAQQHINKDNIYNYEILIPSVEKIKQFSKIIKPIFDEISCLMFQNKYLKQIQDILISQFITGKRELKENQPITTGKRDFFKEAIIFSYYIKIVSTPTFYPTHLRAAKNIYFADRFSGISPIEKYAEQPFGPYDPKSTYAGAEKIALGKKYVQRIKGGFKTGEKISEIDKYTYPELESVGKVLRLLKFKKDHELELLATVDYIIYKMLETKKEPTALSCLEYIKNSEVWKDKISRLQLSLEKIRQALVVLKELRDNGLPYPE